MLVYVWLLAESCTANYRIILFTRLLSESELLPWSTNLYFWKHKWFCYLPTSHIGTDDLSPLQTPKGYYFTSKLSINIAAYPELELFGQVGSGMIVPAPEYETDSDLYDIVQICKLNLYSGTNIPVSVSLANLTKRLSIVFKVGFWFWLIWKAEFGSGLNQSWSTTMKFYSRKKTP